MEVVRSARYHGFKFLPAAAAALKSITKSAALLNAWLASCSLFPSHAENVTNATVLANYFVTTGLMDSDTEMSGTKRPSSSLESLRRKKFKLSELPISSAQRTAIDNLLYSFKKKGGFDSLRKEVWAKFNGSVCYYYTRS